VSPADRSRWRPRARSSTTRICSPNASATASTQPSGCASPPPTWNAPARNSSVSPRWPWPVRSADTPPTVICRARAPRAIGVHVAGQGPSVRATCADWRMPPSELDRKTLKPQVADLGSPDQGTRSIRAVLMIDRNTASQPARQLWSVVGRHDLPVSRSKAGRTSTVSHTMRSVAIRPSSASSARSTTSNGAAAPDGSGQSKWNQNEISAAPCWVRPSATPSRVRPARLVSAKS
jgi:hypothetical protein